MDCEICGKPATKNAIIEEVKLHVCNTCVKLGQELREPSSPVKKIISDRPSSVQTIVPDSGTRIKKAREKLGLSQKDFALKVKEHQSVIHNLETGRLDLTLSLARKLEKALQITLIEEHKDFAVSVPKTKSDPVVTIGDIIRIK